MRLTALYFMLAGVSILIGITPQGVAQTTTKVKNTIIAPKPSDFIAALPTREQLADYDSYKASNELNDHEVFATRTSDGLMLRITVAIADDEQHSLALCKNYLSACSAPGGMAAGSLTGHKVGQQDWHSFYNAGTQPAGGFVMMFHDGRSVVWVYLMYSGEKINDPLDTADLRFAEDQAIACFDRLTKLGYTSRPISKAPAKGIKSNKAVKPAPTDKGSGGKS